MCPTCTSGHQPKQLVTPTPAAGSPCARILNLPAGSGTLLLPSTDGTQAHACLQPGLAITACTGASACSSPSSLHAKAASPALVFFNTHLAEGALVPMHTKRGGGRQAKQQWRQQGHRAAPTRRDSGQEGEKTNRAQHNHWQMSNFRENLESTAGESRGEGAVKILLARGCFC